MLNLTSRVKNQFESSLSKSRGVFDSLIQPLLRSYLGGDLLYVKDDVFNKKCCIDCWLVKDYYMKGISYRIVCVMEGRKPFNSFTIRKTTVNSNITEYKKLTDITDKKEEGWLYPYYMVQANVEKETDRFLSCGIIKMEDLFAYIKEGGFKVRNTYDATFIVCEWDDIVNKGFDVTVIED